MSEYNFYKLHPEYIYIEDFLSTLENLCIYWSEEQSDKDAFLPYATDREKVYIQLKDTLWDKYHRPYLDKKRLDKKYSLKNIFNPFK